MKKTLITIVSFSVFIGLFLMFFKPFDLENFSSSHLNLRLAGYGGVTFIALLINFIIIPALFSTFFANWLIYKELIYSIWNLSLVAFGNWMYTSLLSDEGFVVYNLFKFFYITVLVGIIPMTIHFLLKERMQMQQSISEMKVKTQFSEEGTAESTNIIELYAGSKKSLLIPFSNLVCIESLGNYCTVYYKKDDQLEKAVIRSSLKSIQDQVEAYEQIQRCHKSYIVNLKNVMEVKGNAKGYRLEIPDLEFPIPVSRSFPIKKIEQQLHLQ